MIGISLTQIAWATAFFLAGYALFGALMLGVGAIADTARHAQQLSGVFTLTAMIPFMFSFVIIQSPNGLFARVLTFVPVTAPITVMFRMSAGHLAPRGARRRPWRCWSSPPGSPSRPPGACSGSPCSSTGTQASPGQIWRWLRQGG